MKISRRRFLGTGAAAVAGGSFMVGFTLRAVAQDTPGVVTDKSNPFNAWIHVKADNSTELVLAQSEMGQGVYTALPMLLAEEADLDWERITVVQSEHSLGTGGSGSVKSNYLPLRRAGAQVRLAMVAAAARKWNVPETECTTAKSAVMHAASGRKATYGELVPVACAAPCPDAKTVKLKEPTQFTLLGKATPHLDIPDKCTGATRFGLDVRLPGMVYAVVARCPTFGGKPAKFDGAKALAVPGVLQVFEIPARGTGVFTAGGVAVVGKTTWAAMEGRKALEITWNHGPSHGENSEALRAAMKEALAKPPVWNSEPKEDVDGLPAAKHVEAVYEFPFLAHATMEPMNMTIHLRGDKCEVWSPSQGGEVMAKTVAKELGLQEANVAVHTTFMGGGFGRRYQYDFPTEAAQIARNVSTPVQLVWTREDDMAHDFYRPAGMHRMRGALDAQGNVTGWFDHIADTAIADFWSAPGEYKPNGEELPPPIPYPVPHIQLGFTPIKSAVPRAWWRSVENSFNGFMVESFIDELAHAAGQDPYQFRKRLLQMPAIPRPKTEGGEGGPPPDMKRLVAVLDLVAEKAGWSKPLGPNRGRGIACTTTYAYLAEVAEVTVDHDNIRVDRLVMAVDCGQVVNPNGARSQLEGGMMFTLSAVLKEAITIKDGAAAQQNFDDYSVLRISEAPALETHFVESHDDPHGLGEAAVWLTGPAIANAVFAATGKRLRRMPLRMDEKSV